MEQDRLNMIEGTQLTMVPEILLYNLLNVILDEVKNDYNRESDKSKTLLYRIFHGLKDHKRDYYVESVDLFTKREDGHPRKLSVRQFFDAKQAPIPTYHITMPSENTGSDNTIGIGEDGLRSFHEIDEDSRTITPYYERSFETTYHIICTSDNPAETLMMYHVLRAGLISMWDSLELAGFRNIKLSGQELRINPENVPTHIFMRGIGISCEVDVVVPRFYDNKIISNVIINKGNSQAP